MEPGQHPQEATIGDAAIRYTLSIPEGDPNGAPLVLCLHFAGHGAAWFGKGLLEMLIEPAYRSLNPVIVAPDCPGNSWTAPGVDAIVLDLLAAIEKTHQTDPKRVVVTGYSMGGIGTWYFSARHGDRFSAGVPIAGRPSGTLPTIPMFIVHGVDDEIIHISKDRAAARTLAEQGQNVEFRPLKGPTHYQLTAHQDGLTDVPSWLQRVWAKA